MIPKPKKKKKSQKSNSEISTETYWEVYHREKGCCAVCGSKDGLEEHHIVTRSKGGTGTPDNLILLCKDCHYNKLHGMGDFVTKMRVYQYMIRIGYTKYRSHLSRLQYREEQINANRTTR